MEMPCTGISKRLGRMPSLLFFLTAQLLVVLDLHFIPLFCCFVKRAPLQIWRQISLLHIMARITMGIFVAFMAQFDCPLIVGIP
ncbi:hypothetical protein D3C76_1676380 [compost metagenome]